METTLITAAAGGVGGGRAATPTPATMPGDTYSASIPGLGADPGGFVGVSRVRALMAPYDEETAVLAPRVRTETLGQPGTALTPSTGASGTTGNGGQLPGPDAIPELSPGTLSGLPAPNVPTDPVGTVAEDPAVNKVIDAFTSMFGSGGGGSSGGGGGGVTVTPVPVDTGSAGGGVNTRAVLGLALVAGGGYLAYRYWRKRQGATAA